MVLPKSIPIRERGQRTTLQKLVRWFFILFFGGFLLGVLTLAGIFYYYSKELPDYTSLKGFSYVKVTRVHGANGELIGEFLFQGPSGEKERRTPVDFKDIPPRLVDAFLCAEDADFYQHGGIDYFGIARALFKAVVNQEFTQGASTVTQQVVKTFLLTPERTFKRKFQELILAKRIEEYLTKEEILTLYLNQIYFGNQRYGIVEASRYYFGKELKSLSLSEMAILAGLPKAPSDLNPKEAQKSPEKMKESVNRRKFVLNQMVNKGKITKAEMEAADKEPIAFNKPDEQYVGIAPGFLTEVKKLLEKQFDPSQLPYLGARIDTGLDPKMQLEAQKALRAALEKLDIDQNYRDPKLDHPKKPQDFRMDQVGAIKKVMERHKDTPDDDNLQLYYGETYRALIVGVSDKLGGYIVDIGGILGWLPLKGNERFNPKGKVPSAFATVGDVIPVVIASPLAESSPQTYGQLTQKDPNAKQLDADGVSIKDSQKLEKEFAMSLGPEGAIVSIDPETFEIRAMVGGYEEKPGGVNRALSLRQPGSTFKPIVYAAALELKCSDIEIASTGRVEKRCYSPSTILRDTQIVKGGWIPKNADGKELGEISMRTSLALSRNHSTINLADEIGMKRVIDLAKRMGYESVITDNLSSALGTSEVTPLEQAMAYSVFASGGFWKKPVYVRKITLPDGNVTEFKEEKKQVLTPDVAYLITSVLQSVIQEGTGSKARELKRPAAGKTGSTDKVVDAWFAGFTPQLTAALWLGFDDRRPLGNPKRGKSVSGGGNAAPFWTQYMKGALAGKPTTAFKEPTGIVHMQIDPKTGLRAYDEQKDARDEIFALDAVPKEVAPRPDEATIDDYITSNSTAVSSSSSQVDHSSED